MCTSYGILASVWYFHSSACMQVYLSLYFSVCLFYVSDYVCLFFTWHISCKLFLVCMYHILQDKSYFLYKTSVQDVFVYANLNLSVFQSKNLNNNPPLSSHNNLCQFWSRLVSLASLAYMYMSPNRSTDTVLLKNELDIKLMVWWRVKRFDEGNKY